MATLLICPECGGVRGATETTEAGPPCTCSRPIPSNTVFGAAAGIKVCCICGTDVTGKKRYKDKEGRYFCPDCNDAGAQPPAKPAPPKEADCGDCKKTFPREELAEVNGQLICEGCKAERVARERRERARILAAEVEAMEEEKRKKRLLIITAVVAVLIIALIILLQFRG